MSTLPPKSTNEVQFLNYWLRDSNTTAPMPFKVKNKNKNKLIVISFRKWTAIHIMQTFAKSMISLTSMALSTNGYCATHTILITIDLATISTGLQKIYLEKR